MFRYSVVLWVTGIQIQHQAHYRVNISRHGTTIAPELLPNTTSTELSSIVEKIIKESKHNTNGRPSKLHEQRGVLRMMMMLWPADGPS